MNKMNVKVILENVRCSYVFIDKESSNGGYGVQPLIEEDSKDHKKLQKVVDKVLAGAFGSDAAKKKGKYKLPLRSGNEERDGEEYQDVIFFNANSSRKPGIVNRNNEPADVDDMEQYGYSGAYFNVSLNFYAFPSIDGGKPGVAVGLNNIMLKKKGDRLDGSTSATSDFADFAEDHDDFDDDDL